MGAMTMMDISDGLGIAKRTVRGGQPCHTWLTLEDETR